MAEQLDDELQAALALSLQQSNTTQVSENVPTTNTNSTNNSTTSTNSNEENLASLVAMGFEENNARQALVATNNNIEAATSL